MNKRFSEEQIIGFLREADKGVAVKDLCRKRGFSEASFYLWRSKYGGMNVSDAKRLKAPEAENTKLKKLLAEAMLENDSDQGGASKKMATAPARRELVRWMKTRGLTARRGLAIAGISASSLRYQPRPPLCENAWLNGTRAQAGHSMIWWFTPSPGGSPSIR